MVVTARTLARLISAIERNAAMEISETDDNSSTGYIGACAVKASAQYYLRILQEDDHEHPSGR